MKLPGDIPMTATVRIGKTTMLIRDVLNLSAGSMITLDKDVNDPVDILVNGKLFARGQVVTIDEHFAVRITELIGQENPERKTQ